VLSTDFCFPMIRLRTPVPLFRSQHLFEAYASPLRPKACALEEGGWGTWRFKTHRSASAGGLGLARGVLLPRTLDTAVPLTSLSPPRGPISLTRDGIRAKWPRSLLLTFREEPSATTIRDAFHRQPPTPSAGRSPLRRRSRDASVPRDRQSLFAHASVLSHVSLELGVRPRARSKSGEMEEHCFSTPDLSVDFCHDNNARARPRASNPRPRRQEGVSARVVALAFASCVPEGTQRARAPPLPRESRQRASSHHRYRPSAVQA
jgi:hypothetical protein